MKKCKNENKEEEERIKLKNTTLRPRENNVDDLFFFFYLS
jgi:hypothetical protein